MLEPRRNLSIDSLDSAMAAVEPAGQKLNYTTII